MSEYDDIRNKFEKQKNKLQSYIKNYQKLKTVHRRVVEDLEVKNQSLVTPVKITHSVGLQVSLVHKEITIQKKKTNSSNQQNATTSEYNIKGIIDWKLPGK